MCFPLHSVSDGQVKTTELFWVEQFLLLQCSDHQSKKSPCVPKQEFVSVWRKKLMTRQTIQMGHGRILLASRQVRINTLKTLWENRCAIWGKTKLYCQHLDILSTLFFNRLGTTSWITLCSCLDNNQNPVFGLSQRKPQCVDVGILRSWHVHNFRRVSCELISRAPHRWEILQPYNFTSDIFTHAVCARQSLRVQRRHTVPCEPKWSCRPSATL